jgi:hypothetical protein
MSTSRDFPQTDEGDTTMTAYRIFVAIGTVVALLFWAVRAPIFIEMTRTGEIMPIALLLILASLISLALGGVRACFGKGGRIPFALHIAFAVTAAVLMPYFPVAPLALSLAVAVAALAWSAAVPEYGAMAARDKQ